MPKQKYLYEVEVPAKEVWVFQVEATNAKEAYKFASENENFGADGLLNNLTQICSTSGSKKKVVRLGKVTT